MREAPAAVTAAEAEEGMRAAVVQAEAATDAVVTAAGLLVVVTVEAD